MLKSAFPAALMLLAVASSGCPIYDSSDGCFDDFDCQSGFVCNQSTGACALASYPPASTGACQQPKDCRANETCSHSGTCVVGDCHYQSIGCVRGYSCSLEASTSANTSSWMCVPGTSSEGGAPSSGNAGAAGDGEMSGAGAPPAAGGAPG